MKVKAINWTSFQRQDPKQTVVIHTQTRNKSEYRNGLNYWTRIFIKNFQSRDEAWDWCKTQNLRNRTAINKDGIAVTHSIRLLKLAKAIRELEQDRPKNTSAMIVL